MKVPVGGGRGTGASPSTACCFVRKPLSGTVAMERGDGVNSKRMTGMMGSLAKEQGVGKSPERRLRGSCLVEAGSGQGSEVAKGPCQGHTPPVPSGRCVEHREPMLILQKLRSQAMRRPVVSGGSTVGGRRSTWLCSLWGLLLQVRYGSFPLGQAKPCFANSSIQKLAGDPCTKGDSPPPDLGSRLTGSPASLTLTDPLQAHVRRGPVQGRELSFPHFTDGDTEEPNCSGSEGTPSPYAAGPPRSGLERGPPRSSIPPAWAWARQPGR